MTVAYGGDIQPIYSTSIRVHQQVASAKKRNHCLGRYRVGLTAGQAHDAPTTLRLLDRLEPRTIVLGNKACDGNAIRELIEGKGAVPNIPAKSNRKRLPCSSKTLYRERNQVERFFSKLTHFSRIVTRYDKLAERFLALVQLASMRMWLRTYGSTA